MGEGRRGWAARRTIAIAIAGTIGLAGVLAPRTAEAAIPGTVAVVELEDARGGLAPDARARLSTHLRTLLGQTGVTVIAVAGAGPALKAVAPAALVTSLVVVGRRFVLVAEMRDLETQAVLAQARGEVDVPEGVSPERRLRAALTDITAQLRGEIPQGQLRPVPPGDDEPESPEGPIEPEPPQPPDDPTPVEPEPTAKNRYAFQPGLFARAARFTGLMQLSLVTNEADEHYGPLQLAGWRNTAGTFVGALQLSLRQNKIDQEFYGLTQVSLFDNDARGFTGLIQLAPRNDVENLTGVGQIGLLNMVGEGDSGSDARYAGVVQAGLVNVHHRDVYTLAQVGLGNLGGRANMTAGVSIGAASLFPDGDFTGGLQAGAVSLTGRDFSGLVQVGALAGTMRTFSGVLQLGVVSYVGNNLYRELLGFNIDNSENEREDFRGLAQAGVVSLTDDDFRGVLQVGALGNLVGRDAFALAQVAPGNFIDKGFYGLTQIGAVNIVDGFAGLFQVGIVSYAGRDLYGTQLGAVNLARHANGVQIGVVNVTDRLRGLQLGLLNISSEGGLPVTGIANLGF